MGSFSWCFCDRGTIKKKYGELRPKRNQRLIWNHPGSVLFPKEFGGKDVQIDVDAYEDYGRFHGVDIYDLVADWNREWIAAHPDWVLPSEASRKDSKTISAKVWYPFYADLSLTREEVVRKWSDLDKPGLFPPEYRGIGITIACYDEDNAALPYPIKIAANPASVYEECPPSLGDPYQGSFS